MEQVIEVKGQSEEGAVADEQIQDLSLELLLNVGGGFVSTKI